MIYVLITLSYIFFLRKQNEDIVINTHTVSADKTDTYNRENKRLVYFQRAFKTIVENKRGLIMMAPATSMLLFWLLIGFGLTLFPFGNAPAMPRLAAYPGRCSGMSYRPLRL